MSTITTNTILSGPCKLVYDGATFYSEGNVTVKMVEERFKIKVAGFRDLQERVSDRKYEISFKPAGEWRNLSVLFPYGSTAIGSQIFTNETLTIWCKDAVNELVFSNAAITKLPGVFMSVKQTLLGNMTFTCLLKDGTAPGDSDAYLVGNTTTYPTETLDVSTILTRVTACNWGTSNAPWTPFNINEGGVVWDFPVNFRPQKEANNGTVNMVLTEHSATAKFTPTGITVAQYLAATGANGVMGSAPTVNNFIVSGTGIHLTLYSAQMSSVNLNFGLESDRIGEMMAMANQTFSAGAANPIYRIGTAAP